MSKVSWKDKFESKLNIQVKKLNKIYWGNPIGSKMLIPSPKVIQEYINNSEFGDKLDVRTMRNDLAIEFNADFTCPMTTGIFLKIVAEYNYEKLKEKKEIEEICPFWRIIEPKSKLAEKLTFGKKFIIENRIVEKIDN